MEKIIGRNVKSKTFKRILSGFLALVMVLAFVPANLVETDAAGKMTLAELRQKFPHGKYWNHAGNPGSSNSVNNQDGYTSTPCSKHGTIGTSKQTCNAFVPSGTQLSWQCMGYAEKLGYDFTGFNPRNNANGWKTLTSSSALNNLKPGDIVRYKNNGHSIFVTAVNGDTVTYTDCNSDGKCGIRWDVTISKSTLKATFTNLRSAPYAIDGGSVACNCSDSYAGEYVCSTTGSPLNIRSGHGSNYGVVGSIPSGATVNVSKANGEWAHVTYNGVSGYSSMQYLSRKQNAPQRDTRIQLWLSDTAMGESVGTIRTGEWLYLCYKIFDLNSGELFDTYNEDGYTATLIMYEPDGKVAHTYTYDNDNNWISIRRNVPGEYTGKIEFACDGGGTATVGVSINMVYEPKVIPSSTSVSLNISGVNSQTVSISYSGATLSDSIYLTCSTSGDCFDYDWGNWTDHKMPLTLTGKKAGKGTFTVEMRDYDTDELLATSVINVTVTAPTYTVTYNANGGTGAPAKQTKEYNVALSLSSTIPTRSGYTFLGWSTNSGATTAAYKPGASFTSNANTTLYAVWKSGCSDDAHSYGYKVTKSPTTSACGTLVGTCTKCNGTTTITLPKLNTSDYTYKVTKAAGCTTMGTGRYTWNKTTYGSFYFEVSIAENGHKYTHKVTEATCTAQGYTTHTCSVCNSSYKDTYTSAKGHSYGYKVTKTPTASACGTLTGTCTKCNGTTTITLPKLNESDYTYKVTRTADCTTKGTGRYTWNKTTYGSFYFDVEVPTAEHKYTHNVTAATCTEQGYTTHICTVCDYSYKDTYTNAKGHSYILGKCTSCGQSNGAIEDNEAVDDKGNTARLDFVNAQAGDTVDINLSFDQKLDIKSIGINNITYDTSKLELISGEWLLNGTTLSDFNQSQKTGIATFGKSTTVEGNIIRLTFRVKENVTDGDIAVTCNVLAKGTEGGDEFDVTIKVLPGGVKIVSVKVGDLNGDDKVTSDDAIYLLYNTLFGNSVYPVNQSIDYNGDGKTNSDDAIYLLYHSLFGASAYPLN